MIKISRQEADMLREKVPGAHIAIVNRQHRSKEKTYYAEENRETMPLIYEMRGLPTPRQYAPKAVPAWKQKQRERRDWR